MLNRAKLEKNMDIVFNIKYFQMYFTQNLYSQETNNKYRDKY